jgi:hypothetical protein
MQLQHRSPPACRPPHTHNTNRPTHPTPQVAKNITLAGVGSVTLLDDAPATDHEGRSFLVTSPAAAGVSCAAAAAKTLQAMNPLVRVAAAPGAASAQLLDPDFLAQFDLVVAAGQPPRLARRAGELCFARGVKFMAAAVRGTGSFYFVDLGSHSYKPKGEGDAAASGGRQPDQMRIEYARLGAALSTPLGELPPNCHLIVPILIGEAGRRQGGGRGGAGGGWKAAAACLMGNPYYQNTSLPIPSPTQNLNLNYKQPSPRQRRSWAGPSRPPTPMPLPPRCSASFQPPAARPPPGPPQLPSSFRGGWRPATSSRPWRPCWAA